MVIFHCVRKMARRLIIAQNYQKLNYSEIKSWTICEIISSLAVFKNGLNQYLLDKMLNQLGVKSVTTKTSSEFRAKFGSPK